MVSACQQMNGSKTMVHLHGGILCSTMNMLSKAIHIINICNMYPCNFFKTHRKSGCIEANKLMRDSDVKLKREIKNIGHQALAGYSVG